MIPALRTVSSCLLRIRASAILEYSLAVLLAGGCLSAGLALAATMTPRGPATASAAPQRPIIVNAAFSHVDYQTGTAIFRDIVVVQGDTRLTAERARATGLSFRNSRWTFGGNVVINVQPRGTLRSDQAVVQIRGNRVIVVTATGQPALFEQQRTPSLGAVHGHAHIIVYNAKEGTARLSGDAWLADGHNEISAPLLVYNFRNETMQAASPGGRRDVHITLPQGAPQRLRRPAAKSPHPPP